jgi:hypothetical protein
MKVLAIVNMVDVRSSVLSAWFGAWFPSRSRSRTVADCSLLTSDESSAAARLLETLGRERDTVSDFTDENRRLPSFSPRALSRTNPFLSRDRRSDVGAQHAATENR